MVISSCLSFFISLITTNIVVNEESIVIDQKEGNKVSLELLDEAIPFKLNQDIFYHKYGLYDEYMNDLTYINSDNPYTFCLYTKNLGYKQILADIDEIVYNYNTNNI